MYPVSEDIKGLKPAIDSICHRAAQAATDGYQLIVLSDKKAGKRLVPIRYISLFKKLNFSSIPVLVYI